VASSGGTHERPQRLGPGLILVDAASGAVRADVPVGDSQGATRFGYGFVWTLGENGVMAEVDPDKGAPVRFIPVGLVWGGMAVGAGGIWVTDRNGPTLLRIDPVTGQINLRARLSSLGLSKEQPNSGMAIDAGSLWVARGPEAVDRLDPSSLKLQRRIMLNQQGCGTGGAQCFMAAGEGRVWVAGGSAAHGEAAEIRPQAEHEGGVLAVVRPNPGYRGARRRHLGGIVFHIDVGERPAIEQVRRGQLDYFVGRSTAVSRRVGCRTELPGVPGLDLAALCVRPIAS
jgi:hypothetical protein